MTRFQFAFRSFVKRFIYSQLSLRNALLIAIGREKPLIRFKIEKDPPSIYWVFEIEADQRQRLERDLDLPPEFKLTTIRCLPSDEPKYLMVVNAYRVSGLAKGLRAEWSIFVADGHQKPNYMVIDARSSQRSMDPISIITPATSVTHSQQESILATHIGDSPQEFISEIDSTLQHKEVLLDNAWIAANDKIYWSNGVMDHSFYNGAFATEAQLLIDPRAAKISDNTPWSKYLNPNPLHILMLAQPVELVISPWDNI